jgi:hypothetical protein
MKRSVRDFSELRSLLKKTETEAEAQAEVRASEGTRSLPRAPKPRRAPSPADEFIVATLGISLREIPVGQLADVRCTIREAIETANHAIIVIRGQLEAAGGPIGVDERSWRVRAGAALQHKIFEGQALQKKLQQVDELLKAPAPVKLLPMPTKPTTVVSLLPSAPSKPVAAPAYEIRTGVPRPVGRHFDHDAEWKKYPFARLNVDQSFRFPPDVSAEKVRGLVSAAARNLGWRFSYRTEQDKVVAVWRIVDGPGPGRRKKEK